MNMLSPGRVIWIFIATIVVGLASPVSAAPKPTNGAVTHSTQGIQSVPARGYRWPIFIPTTSDGVVKDGVMADEPICIVYGQVGDVWSDLMEWQFQRTCRHWKPGCIRFYKIDVKADPDTGSRTSFTPTELLVKFDSSGFMWVLNAHVGFLTYGAAYEFFVRGLQNPLVKPGTAMDDANVVIDCYASDVQFEIERHGARPAILLYYNSDSLASRAEAQLFELLARAHQKEFTFLRLDTIQDDQGTSAFGGIVPAIQLCRADGQGHVNVSQPVLGFRDMGQLEYFVRHAPKH